MWSDFKSLWETSPFFRGTVAVCAIGAAMLLVNPGGAPTGPATPQAPATPPITPTSAVQDPLGAAKQVINDPASLPKSILPNGPGGPRTLTDRLGGAVIDGATKAAGSFFQD